MGSHDDATEYAARLTRIGREVEIMTFQVAERDLSVMRTLDIDGLPGNGADEFMERHSRLWNAHATPHGYDHLIRGANEGRKEHFFDKRVFPMLDFT